MEASTIYHEVNSFVVHPTMGVNTTTVILAFIVIGAGHCSRIAKSWRVSHVAERTQARYILSHQPSDTRSILALTIGLIIKLTPQVREGFVDRPGLIIVKQVGFVFCDTVC